MLDLEITEINEQHAHNAKVLAGGLSSAEVRKKGMIDLLGIYCVVSYLRSKRIRIETKRSIHRIAPLFEEFKICDIYYGNYRIDVITLYKEKMVRIPKIHAENDIMPYFYFIVQIGSRIKEAKMIGFLEAKSVLASRSDSKYFYPSLESVFGVDRFSSLTRRPIFAKSMLGKHIDCMGLFLKFIDNDLPSVYKKQLIQHLLGCESCRNRFVDALEFERLARSVQNYPSLIKKYSNPPKVKEREYTTDAISEFEANIEQAPVEETAQIEETKELNIEEVEKLDRTQLSKRLVESIFSDIPKFELTQIKTLVNSRSKRAIMIIGVLFFVLASFSLIALKDNAAIKAENEEIAEFGETENFESLDDYYNHVPGQAKLIPKQSDVNDYIIKQPITTKPVYSPSVTRVSWEAPESLVKDANYTRFLQLAGKNIKLNLQNDLLLVNDIPTARIAKVDIKFGSSSPVKISQSSGAKAIDASIEKVVNDTIKYMKPPSLGLLSRTPEVTLCVELN